MMLQLLISIFTLFSPNLYADEFIHLDGSYVCLQENIASNEMTYEIYEMSNHAISCQRMNEVQRYLGSSAIAIQATSLYLACTGIGATVSVKLMATGFGVQFLNFVVGNIPCRDYETEHRIHNQIQDSVCTALEANGIPCYLDQPSIGPIRGASGV